MPVFASAITPGSVALIEIDWPQGTAKYAHISSGVVSHSQGAYKAVIESFGELEFAMGDDSKALQHGVMNVVIVDEDEALSNMIGVGRFWEQSVFRLYVAPPEAATKASWTVFNVGVVDDMQPSGRGKWRATLTRKVRQLKAPDYLSQVNKYDFNDSDKSALGNQIPALVGKGDDYGDQTTGAIPTLYVDRVLFWYLVGEGWLTVLRVFSGGVLKVVTTHYVILHTTIGGRLYTIIDFGADQGSSQVTCDVEGPDTNGDGTGTVMVTEATDVLLFFLANHIYGEYAGGAPISGAGTAPVNTTSFTTVKAALAGRAGGAAFVSAIYIAAQASGESLINEWASSMGVDVAWDQNGNLALYFDDCYANSPGYSDPLFRFPTEVWDAALALESRGLINTAVIQYATFSSEPTTAAPQGTTAKLRKHKPDPANRDGRGYYQLQVTTDQSAVNVSVNINATSGPKTTP